MGNIPANAGICGIDIDHGRLSLFLIAYLILQGGEHNSRRLRVESGLVIRPYIHKGCSDDGGSNIKHGRNRFAANTSWEPHTLMFSKPESDMTSVSPQPTPSAHIAYGKKFQRIFNLN